MTNEMMTIERTAARGIANEEAMRNVTKIDSLYLAGESRDVPWAKLATCVEDAQTADNVLQMAGLNWTVQQTPMAYEVNGKIRYTNQLVNYRSDTGEAIGVVTNNYKPVQNADAFAFTELLVDSGSAVYNAAGSFKNGAITFVSLEMPVTRILGDLHDQYILVVADHTGKHAVRIFPTCVRVSCLNTLNLALKNAERMISISHIGDIETKMEDARSALFATKHYTAELAKTAESLAKIKVGQSDEERLFDTLFKIDETANNTRVENMKYMREAFNAALNVPDLANFKGTAWQYVQAASDLSYHRKSLRKNSKHDEGIFRQMMTGAKILDITYDWAQCLVA